MKYEFFTGSYGRVGEEGILKMVFDTDAMSLSKVWACDAIKNPSYVLLSGDEKVLYAVQEETPVGAVHSMRLKEDGSGAVPVKCLSTEGADPCHLSLSPDRRLLFAANYTSGSLAVFALSEDGQLKDMCDFDQHEGKGPNVKRQECAHVHFSQMHEGQLFCVDLGMDRVFVYDIEEETGKLHDTGIKLQLPPGDGPRHLAFSRTDANLVYVACELESKVAVFEKCGEGYVMRQILSTLPADYDFSVGTKVAAIRISGDLLFVSNRGDDSIASYRIGEDGLLTLCDIARCGGENPRDFNVMENFLVIANQDTDSITVLEFDPKSGSMQDTGLKFETVKPTCICLCGAADRV